MSIFGYRRYKLVIVFTAILILVVSIFSCTNEKPAASPTAPPPQIGSLSVSPTKVELSFPGLLAVPITFTVSGFGNNEVVEVYMELPPEVEVKGISPGEPLGLAAIQTDDSGSGTAAIETVTKILSLLRGELAYPGVPVNESFGNPLPAGVYKLAAIGDMSSITSTTTIEFTLPAPAEK